MDGRINVIDISSFLLFESTGDSDADPDLNTTSLTDQADLDDDAQSSSCDSSRVSKLYDQTDFHYHHNIHDDDNDDDDDNDNHEDDDNHDDDNEEDDDDDEEDAIDQVWRGNKVSEVVMGRRQHKKAKVCVVDAAMEIMDERDKDRLFWEACLAS